MSPAELMENFQMLMNWEDKYRYLIELGEKLRDFPETDKTDANKVEGCQAQVWITHRVEGDKHYFNATSDSHIVRGLQAVLLTFVNGLTSQEIQKLDMLAIFKRMGLEEHLSPSRRNGFLAMTNRIFSLTF
ncbi:MAG: SufE family protein [Alphaproteobacteria bacterium]|nr:SufE family protein [Alphaproteobacteria bacterium]